ncbi:MAG TPA: hypothetical protein VHN11_09875 [Xanthobacteraceae bacterium]|nr:hypothetical protein [Xanthobacteraceae bacterium]
MSRGVVFALAICLTLAAVSLTYVANALWPRWPGASTMPNAPSLPITIGGTAFNVPPAAIRIPLQRRPGTQERIDLAFLWPSLAPPDPTPQAPRPSKPVTGEALNALDRVFITVSAANSEIPPNERMKAIYPRYLEDRQLSGPEGLFVIPFREGTPYQHEDLFFEAAAQDHFVARCTRPNADITPGTCLIEQRIGSADITIRFLRDWLSDWRKLSSDIDRLLAKLRSSGS